MINLKNKDSVADAVSDVLQQEALKGQQHLIDKNKNKKIDAQDFKILRGEKSTSKKVEEEAEKNKLDSKLIKSVAGDEAEETPARKSIKAHGGEIEQPKVGVAKEEVEKRAHLTKTLKNFKEKYEKNSIYDQMIQEVLSKDATAGEWIHDFVHSDNPKFAGKSKEQRKKQALAAYYAKQRNEEVEQVEEASSVKVKTGKTDAVGNALAKQKMTSYFAQRRAENEKNKPKNEEVELDEGLGDTIKKGLKKAAEVLGGPDDKGQLKNLQKKMGVPQTGEKPVQKEDVEELDEKIDQKKKTMDTLGGRVKVPSDTHNQHTEPKVELNSEGWDDMLKAVKARSGPQPSGGSGVKQGSRYGGSKQKEKPEQDDDKKKVTESKRPEDDSVPFAPPYKTTSDEVITDKSGAKHTPMSRVKHLVKMTMKKINKDMTNK